MYKIGDKVETPLGIGVVVGKRVAMRHDDIIFEVNIKNVKIDFRNTQVIAYKSAHDKLIEMGWEEKIHDTVVKYHVERGRYKQYAKNYEVILIDIEKRDFTTYILYNGDKGVSDVSWVSHELSRILTQYLEEITNE